VFVSVDNFGMIRRGGNRQSDTDGVIDPPSLKGLGSPRSPILDHDFGFPRGPIDVKPEFVKSVNESIQHDVNTLMKEGRGSWP
jgi:hypothetical protein